MRRDDRQAEAAERRYPEATAKIPVEQWPASAAPWQGPWLAVTEAGKHPMQFARPARADETPFHHHGADRLHIGMSRVPSHRLGYIGDGAVALLHAAE